MLTISSLLMACGPLGGDDGGGGQQGQTPENTGSQSGAVASTDDVDDATVYIQAAGGVYDQGRQFGEQSVGQGSGLILDPSGLALTNNHVVAGAGFLEVYVNGEEDARGAKILGRSECSDLALIDIDEGGYPYLEWRDGPIEGNLDVRAAGFPATDETLEDGPPDFTITRGIVNTTEADGNTQWASVDSVLEHDALIRGGNSGGPLIDEEGKAVGVNYATNTDPETGAETGQSFAISRDEAQDLLEQMKQGDVDSIGINGLAFSDPEAELSGIGVVSTVTGSPAANVGVRNFVVNEETQQPQELDLITKLEGTTLAENGTMEEYCNVLRGRGSPEQPLSIEVLRSTFDEAGTPTSIVRYEGVLNGSPDQKLKPVETLLGEPAPEEGAQAEPSEPASGETAGSGYVQVVDDSGALAMEVPAAWSDVDGAPRELSGVTTDAAVTASADVAAWTEGYEEPGASMLASVELASQYTPEALLDANDFSADCQDTAREPYDDGSYAGFVDAYTGCGESGNELVVIASTPPSGEYMLVLMIQTPPDAAGNEARERIIQLSTIDETILLG